MIWYRMIWYNMIWMNVIWHGYDIKCSYFTLLLCHSLLIDRHIHIWSICAFIVLKLRLLDQIDLPFCQFPSLSTDEDNPTTRRSLNMLMDDDQELKKNLKFSCKEPKVGSLILILILIIILSLNSFILLKVVQSVWSFWSTLSEENDKSWRSTRIKWKSFLTLLTSRLRI